MTNILTPLLADSINAIFERCQNTHYTAQENDSNTITQIIELIDQGQLRAINADGTTNTTVKQAILCYLRLSPTQQFDYGLPCFDKIPHKLSQHSQDPAFRACPGSHVRYGAYVAESCVLMPCFVNIGAYVGPNTMVDTWSTIGSCAQIGAHCHISGGTGIGGVLEPLTASPVVIGDHVFIGARSEVAEGMHVGNGAVIAAGTILTASTKIYHRDTGQITYGVIPENAVVIPTYLPDESGQFSRYAAMITKYADSRTRSKSSINELLRF